MCVGQLTAKTHHAITVSCQQYRGEEASLESLQLPLELQAAPEPCPFFRDWQGKLPGFFRKWKNKLLLLISLHLSHTGSAKYSLLRFLSVLYAVDNVYLSPNVICMPQKSFVSLRTHSASYMSTVFTHNLKPCGRAQGTGTTVNVGLDIKRQRDLPVLVTKEGSNKVSVVLQALLDYKGVVVPDVLADAVVDKPCCL